MATAAGAAGAATAPPSGGIVGRVERSTTRTVTAGDVLWVGRAVLGEGGESDRAERLAVLGVIVRRWMLGSGASLAASVRGFSQPVNPRWLPGGDLWVAHAAALARGERAGQESITSAAAGARRQRIQATSWAALPADLRADVLGTLNGTIPLQGGAAIDFGGPLLYRSRGLVTTSTAARERTAPGAVLARETARGVPEPRYETTDGGRPGGNVFHSSGPSRRATGLIIVPGPDPRPVSLPAPTPAPIGAPGLAPMVIGVCVAVGLAVAVGSLT